MRRSILCFVLVIIATLLFASPASAGRRWCSRDPIVSLNGHAVQVWVAIPEEYVPLVNGPIDIEFRTPTGMSRSIVMTDDGFNGFGEVVTFSDDPRGKVNAQGAFTVQIWVSVPIDEDQADATAKARRFPAQITVIEDSRTQVFHGWSDGSWVSTRIGSGGAK